jgi:hypothetical protein
MITTIVRDSFRYAYETSSLIFYVMTLYRLLKMVLVYTHLILELVTIHLCVCDSEPDVEDDVLNIISPDKKKVGMLVSVMPLMSLLFF